jgi:hypothetical protein
MVTAKQTEGRRLEFGITGFYPAFTGARNAGTSEEMGFDIHGWMGIGGPPSFAVDRVGQLVDMGVDFFMTALSMPEREVFAAEVMPALRSARR